MKPLTIFTRLVIGNVIILVLILGMGGVISYDLTRLRALHTDLLTVHQESLSTNETLIDALELLVQFDQKFFATRDPDYYTRFNEQHIIVESEFNTLFPLLDTVEQRYAFDRAINAFQAYLAWFNINARPGDTTAAGNFDILARQRLPLERKVHAHLNAVLSATRQQITRSTKRSGEMAQEIFFVTVATTLLTVLAGIILTLFNTHSIRNSVRRLQHKTQEISAGRFEEIRTMEGPKEIQDLALHFNTMCRRLRELDDLKADFISHVSHELRTPMTSIKEAALMLTKGYYAREPEKQTQLHGLIHDECRRLLGSVMRILDFSKMEAGKMEYQPVIFQMPDLLRSVLLKLAPLARSKGISLEFSPPPSDLPDIRADQDRIIEVLDNLIGNAVKFTPADGRVIVDCRTTESGVIQVRVTDNGPGIALEHLENIFYKFKQIDADLNPRMGTGLGLCISKYIISAHGGDIWAENTESGGTRVSFTLPVSS